MRQIVRDPRPTDVRGAFGPCPGGIIMGNINALDGGDPPHSARDVEQRPIPATSNGGVMVR